jgi:glycosyltransferase involved in cell wall biosynthesis
VKLIGGVDSATLIDHLARCRAVCFPAQDEDYGFVTVEAYASAKPVVTCRDSGGPLEFVHDGAEGLVAAPTPEGLARALATVAADEGLASRLGQAGLAAVQKLTWPGVVERVVVV